MEEGDVARFLPNFVTNRTRSTAQALRSATSFPNGTTCLDLLCKKYLKDLPVCIKRLRSDSFAIYSIHGNTFDEFKNLANAERKSSSSDETKAMCSHKELQAYATKGHRSLAITLALSLRCFGPVISLPLRYLRHTIANFLCPARLSIANSDSLPERSRKSRAV